MKNSIREIKEIISNHRKSLEQFHKVRSIGVFGSYAKGKADKTSDIDILVDFYDVPDMFKFVKLEYFLRRLLGRRVDLVTRKALKPLIKGDILRDTVYL